MSTQHHTAALPRMTSDQARSVAEAEYSRFVDLVRDLGEGDWTRPTDCDRWDVRAIADHVAGAARQYASVPRTLAAQPRGWLAARRLGLGEPLDGVNELQIQEVAHLTPGQLVDWLEHWAPKAVAARFTLPRLLQRMPVTAMGMSISLGDLYAYVLTRDVWMHRVDITRATGREMVLTPEHDGALVADVVAEWAGRHGRPFDLVLTGAAGGAFGVGEGGELIEIDAVEFCRKISRRAPATGLLAEPAMF